MNSALTQCVDELNMHRPNEIGRMGLSLVLATCDRTHELSRFFESLKKTAENCLEVVVVDQNPDDRLDPIISDVIATGCDVQHIKTFPIRGLSRARNIGIAAAKYRLIGFPDDDCWYEPEVVSRVIDVFLENSAVDAVIGRWVERDSDDKCPTLLDLKAQFSFSGVPLASICFFARVDVVRAVGGFDESFGVGGLFGSSEETDVLFSILSDGYQVLYCPNVRVHHRWDGAAIAKSGTFWKIYKSSCSRALGTGAIYSKHNLNTFTISRGLVMPWVRLLVSCGGLADRAYWLGTAMGRLLGWFFWKKSDTRRSLNQ